MLLLPLSYQYEFSAAIYKILDSADHAYASFLHDEGYKKEDSLKTFKLFTFSDLKTPFKIEGDQMRLTTQQAEILVAFHLPKAAERFIQGIFVQQHIEVADRKNKVAFTVNHVETLPPFLTDAEDQEIVLQPLSPLICGIKNIQGHYDFLSPEHEQFVPMLLQNWKEKYNSQFDEQSTRQAFESTTMEVLYFKNPPKSRLVTIKANTPAETKIRGFVNFKLKVKSKKDALELLMNGGAGLYNALGMGCVGM